jgi:hypothetical protein
LRGRWGRWRGGDERELLGGKDGRDWEMERDGDGARGRGGKEERGIWVLAALLVTVQVVMLRVGRASAQWVFVSFDLRVSL